MNLIEAHPQDPFVSHFIDRYQYYDIEMNTHLKSVPNGKIESWIINQGSCQLWDDDKKAYQESKSSGFYPASNTTADFKIAGGSKCINIKWNLSALSLPFFKRFLKDWTDFSLEEFIGSQSFRALSQADFLNQNHLNVEYLDRIFHQAISKHPIDPIVSHMVCLIATHHPHGFKVPELASQLCVSTKTLERQIKNQIGLAPKELSNILRFTSTTRYHLNQQRRLFFTDSIKFGYYDQSHFIKECKKVTGYTPTEFFSKLKLSTNDLIIESDN